MTPVGDEIVGREAELAILTAFLADRAGLPGAMVIEGSAGAGKTTLWRAVVERAAATGYLVLACRPLGSEVQLSLAALTDLLEPHIAKVLPALPPPQRRAVEIALLLKDDAGQPPDQRALSAGVLNALRTLSGEVPVLVAIDDAQWLDAQSAAILEFAVRRLGAAAVAVVASIRTGTPTVDDPRASRGLQLAMAMGQPLLRVAVGPLSLGAMNRLLRTRTNLEFNRRLLQRIHDTSGGNPFYALELARAIDAGRYGDSDTVDQPRPGEPLALGPGLTTLLADRLDGLTSAARDALFVAAASAQPTIALVTRVLGAPAEEALGPAIAASIVGIQGDAIEFVHPLLAAAAYAGVAPPVQRGWHARLADASTDPEARARHLAVARTGPDLEVANLLREAARQAQIRGAPGAAADLFAESIDRLPPMPSAERAEWVLEAAPVLITVGDKGRARVMLAAVIDELDAGPRRSDALLLQSLVLDDTAGEARLIEQALIEAGGDPRRRAAAMLDRAEMERSEDRLAGALDAAQQALDFAEQSGDARLLALAEARVADLEFLLGLSGEPVARFQRALELDGRARIEPALGAPAMLAACLIRAGRVAEARPYAVGSFQHAVANGDEDGQQHLAIFLAELEWLAGNWDASEAHAVECLEIAEHAGARWRQGALLALLGLLEASRGDPERGRDLALRGRALCEETGDIAYVHYTRGMLGFIELALGNAAAAHDYLDTYSVERGIEGSKRISFTADDIEALTLLGELDRAAELTAALERRAGVLHRPSLSAAAARCRALVLGVRGDLTTAEAAAHEAVDQFTALGLPFELGRSLLVLGEVQRRAKQRRLARETLTAAAEIFARLGARRWASRAEAERARIGGRSTIEGLSETELRVAQLVAEGRSNKEVAAELFVSVRAVESNLSKVYAKLGIRSRTELARRI